MTQALYAHMNNKIIKKIKALSTKTYVHSSIPPGQGPPLFCLAVTHSLLINFTTFSHLV
jgi:hypothetical protein